MDKKPRKHNPAWKDNTASQRTKDRTTQDNMWAYTVSRGKYNTLRKLMTAINKGEIILVEAQPTPRALDTDYCACNPRKHGELFVRGRMICIYCRRPCQ